MSAENAWGLASAIYIGIALAVFILALIHMDDGTPRDRTLGARVAILAPVWIIWPFYGLFLALRALWRAAEWKSNGTAS